MVGVVYRVNDYHAKYLRFRSVPFITSASIYKNKIDLFGIDILLVFQLAVPCVKAPNS